MKLKALSKIKDGKYLKNYELLYENRAGKEKRYEIVSRHEIGTKEELGIHTSGVSIVATMDDKLLLLREFRMGVNKYIYNLCAGMLEKDETIEQCIARELQEETGLIVKEIKHILKPSYAAVAISDIKTSIAFVEVTGVLSQDGLSENESITASFYSKEEVKHLLDTQEFSSRAQMAAYYFAASD